MDIFKSGSTRGADNVGTASPRGSASTDGVNIRHEWCAFWRLPAMPAWMSNLFGRHGARNAGGQIDTESATNSTSGQLLSQSDPRELAWGERANCYAYALNCERPRMTSAVPQACPGAATGRRALHLGDPAADTEALIESVIADGQGAIRQVEGTPAHVPAPAPGEYLFALLTGPRGFHFLRRDSATGVWSWKDGNEESVKLKIFHLPSRKFVPVTDNLLEPLLATNKQDFAWRYHGMTFKSFFSVPETAKVDVAA